MVKMALFIVYLVCGNTMCVSTCQVELFLGNCLAVFYCRGHYREAVAPRMKQLKIHFPRLITGWTIRRQK